MTGPTCLQIVIELPPPTASPLCAALPPPSPPAAAAPSGWASLPFELLLAVVQRIEDPTDRRGTHLTCRVLRDVVCYSLTALAPRTLDTAALRASFPNVSALHLRRLVLGPSQLACLGGLGSQLTSLCLSACSLSGGDGAVLALGSLSRLAALELSDISGPSGEELDDTLRRMTSLHSLKIENRHPAARTPTLKSLAALRRMRALRVKQTPPRQGLHLQHLPELGELRALELEGALITDADLQGLSTLTQLSELLIPNAYQLSNAGLAGLSMLTTLESLDLGCYASVTDQDLTHAGAAHLWELGGLTSLSLAGRNGLTAGGLHFLTGCPGLASLDLSRVRLAGGDTSFLWQLPALTSLRLSGTAMEPAQFDGLSSLTSLRCLDASRTGFDDSCCQQLGCLTCLTELQLCFVSGRLTAAGLALVHAACRQLRVLRLDGAAISSRGMAAALAAHPSAALWPPTRSHLPRALNALHVRLIAVPTPRQRRLRVLHAPETSRSAQAGSLAWAAGVVLAHTALILLLAVFAIVLPLAAAGAAAYAAISCAVMASKLPAARMLDSAQRAEVLVAGLLVGLYRVDLPLSSMTDAAGQGPQ